MGVHIFIVDDDCVPNCSSDDGWVVLCGSECKQYVYCEGGNMLNGPSGNTTTGLTCPEGKVFDTTTQRCQYTSNTCPVPYKFKGNKSPHFSPIYDLMSGNYLFTNTDHIRTWISRFACFKLFTKFGNKYS